jgi:hypothetical protein
MIRGIDIEPKIIAPTFSGHIKTPDDLYIIKTSAQYEHHRRDEEPEAPDSSAMIMHRHRDTDASLVPNNTCGADLTSMAIKDATGEDPSETNYWKRLRASFDSFDPISLSSRDVTTCPSTMKTMYIVRK